MGILLILWADDDDPARHEDENCALGTDFPDDDGGKPGLVVPAAWHFFSNQAEVEVVEANFSEWDHILNEGSLCSFDLVWHLIITSYCIVSRLNIGQKTPNRAYSPKPNPNQTQIEEYSLKA